MESMDLYSSILGLYSKFQIIVLDATRICRMDLLIVPLSKKQLGAMFHRYFSGGQTVKQWSGHVRHSVGETIQQGETIVECRESKRTDLRI